MSRVFQVNQSTFLHFYEDSFNRIIYASIYLYPNSLHYVILMLKWNLYNISNGKIIIIIIITLFEDVWMYEGFDWSFL